MSNLVLPFFFCSVCSVYKNRYGKLNQDLISGHIKQCMPKGSLNNMIKCVKAVKLLQAVYASFSHYSLTLKVH